MTRQRTVHVAIAAAIAVLSVGFFFLWFGGDPFNWSKHSSSKDTLELVGALGFATAFAAICHWLIRRWLVACTICTAVLTMFVAVVSFATNAASESPFVLIGIFTVAVVSFAISALVGTFFLLFRRGASIT